MFPDIRQIKTIRLKKGLTQKDLARISGVSQSLIAKIEKASSSATKRHIDPAYSKVVALFNALFTYNTKTNVCAENIMTRKVIYGKTTNTVSEIINTLTKNSISQAPVLDQKGNIFGSISEENLIKAFENKNTIASKTPIIFLCDDPFPTVNPKTPIDSIIPLFKTHKAVLVCSKGKVIGIITKADLFKVI